MISKRSFYNFLFHNLFFATYGWMECSLLYFSNFSSFSTFFILSLFRNLFLYTLLEINTQKYEFIHLHRNLPSFYLYLPYFFQVSLLDSFHLFFFYSYIHSNSMASHFLQNMLLFIPKSFIFELIFDLFHYWIHRITHIYPLLYKYFHKTHHLEHFPTLLSTFRHHPFDLILSNMIPFWLAFYLSSHLFTIDSHLFHMLLITKIYIELCGHSGREIKTGSFVQCIWLPRIFGNSSLYTCDHDIHHVRGDCNYGKRFSLWDRVFGTYQPGKIEE